MYQKTAINMRLAKIQAKIYDLESLAFKTTEEVNQLLNEVCELVSVRYREAKIQETKSHNLYSDDLTKLTKKTLKIMRKAYEENKSDWFPNQKGETK